MGMLGGEADVHKGMAGLVHVRQVGAVYLRCGGSWLLRGNTGKHNMLNCTVVEVQLLQHLHCSYFRCQSQKAHDHRMMVYCVAQLGEAEV